MKIVVLGASGGVGQKLVELGRIDGHDVVAVVRSSSWTPPPNVEVRRGALTDEGFLSEAFAGADVVLSALGLRVSSLAPWAKAEDPTFLTRSTPAIVAAMEKAGVKRIAAVSAAGVGDSIEGTPAFFRAFIRFTALRLAYAELEVMERVLLESGLDVYIVRPTGLTDGLETGNVRVVSRLSGRATISRADVARTMLDAVKKPSFTAPRTPVITVTG
jgi:uncharacterized protein YbjT (DUF2867 family)